MRSKTATGHRSAHHAIQKLFELVLHRLILKNTECTRDRFDRRKALRHATSPNGVDRSPVGFVERSLEHVVESELRAQCPHRARDLVAKPFRFREARCGDDGQTTVAHRHVADGEGGQGFFAAFALTGVAATFKGIRIVIDPGGKQLVALQSW